MREKIRELLRTILPSEILPEVAFSEQAGKGHYNTNAAFTLSRREKKLPMKIAEEIAEKLTAKALDFVERAEAAKPGFVNIWLTQGVLTKELDRILSEKERYGAGKPTKDKIQVEFISANPTGPLTLANGRGGFFGDVIANVLEFSGTKMEREYYVNDTGRQVEILGKSILARAGHIPNEEEFYKGEYVAEWVKVNAKFVKEHSGDPESVGEKAAEDFLKTIQHTIESGTQ